MADKKLLFALICVFAVLTSVGVVAADEYRVTSDQTIDVVDRTVQQGGSTFEITAVSQVDPSDQVEVSVDAPAETDFRMYLYDENQTIRRGYEGTGPTEFTIPVADHGASTAGTYAFVVQSDGVNEAAHPLVVRGYTVTSTPPGSATRGDEITIDGEFTQVRGEAFKQIDVVVAASDTDEQVVTKARVDGKAFTADVSTAELDAGSYDVYAVVRGPDTVLDEPEILGLSTPQTLEIEQAESNSGGSSGGSSSSEIAASEAPQNEGASASEYVSLSNAPVTRPITDAAPGEGGVRVRVNAGPIENVSFDAPADAASGEMTVRQSAVTVDAFMTQFGSDRVKTAVSITVPEEFEDTPATIQFRLNNTELENTSPADLQVVKNTTNGSQVLSSAITETNGSDVIITARTPGFSEFAVVEAPAETAASGGDETLAEQPSDEDVSATDSSNNSTESTETNTPGFGILVALTALFVTTLAAKYTR